MRVTILEQRYSGGHFLSYVARLVQALQGIADEIVIATPEGCRASPQYGVHLRSLEGRFRLHPVWERHTRHRLPVHQLTFVYADLLRDVVRETACDALLIPGADGIAEAAGLARLVLKRAIPRGVHAEALLIRGAAAYGFHQARRTAFLQRMAMRRLPFDRVHFIDPVVYAWAKSLSGDLAKRCSFVPDPIDPAPAVDREAMRDHFGWPRQARVALSIGPQDGRKGADVLARATAIARLEDDCRVVLAGKIETSLRAKLDAMIASDAHLKQRLILIDRYLSADEFAGAIGAADLILAPYRPQPHPSGVTLQAAAAGKMVLTSDKGWFAHVVPTFQLGMTCDCQSPEALADALPVALDRSTRFVPTELHRALVDFHRPEGFARAWRAGLLERIGRPREVGHADWDALVARAKASPAG